MFFEEKLGFWCLGFSFKFDNSFFGVLEGKISGVFVFNYCLFFFVRFVIRIIFMLSMYRLIFFDDKYGCSYWSFLLGLYGRDDKWFIFEEVRVDGINFYVFG